MPTHASTRVRARQRRRRSSERALGDLWRRADSLTEGLVTEDGTRFRVVYPGRANHRAGPDFHDAVIAAEGAAPITGDVELHLRAPDWYAHHHQDPNYNGVILHVVLSPKGAAESQRQSGMMTPVASLASAVPQLEQERAPAHHVLAHLRSIDGRTLGDVLDRQGHQRFLARSRGFALELDEADPDQVLYRAIMEAMGYSANRKPFRELAERMPMASLKRLTHEPATTRLIALEAMLIGAAGLLSYVRPPERARQARGILSCLPRTAAMPLGQWQLFRVRPANHPVVRIAGAARLVDRYIDVGLVRGLEEEVRRGDAGALTERLAVRPFVGRGRARDAAVNVVLPFLHAYAGIDGSLGLGDKCVELYHAFPRLEDNEITREMTGLLGRRAVRALVTGARRQQGLMHLYKGLATAAGQEAATA